MSTMVDTSFDPMELVKEDLLQPVIETSLQTIKKLPLVAKAIGPADTREKLIPFLVKFAGFDEENRDSLDRVIPDEALAEIAKVLSEFLPLIGGPDHVAMLLNLLENFALAQETCVREAAVESLRILIPKLAAHDPKIVSNFFMPIAKKLSAEDWFSSRCSAAGIIPIAHAHVKDEAEKASLRQMYLVICKDETPLVRKYAYDHLGELAVNAGSHVVKTELIDVLRSLMEETQESLRISAVDVTVRMTEACKANADDFKELAYPLIDHFGSDQSWRVRKTFAKAIADVAAFLPKELAGSTLVPFYFDFIKDPETEVRLSAIKVMGAFAKTVDDKSFSINLTEVLDGIMNDTAQSTRVALSEVILDVAASVGKDTAVKVLLPLIVRLLESDVADMRSNVLEKLGLLAETIGVAEVVSQFLPKLLPMAKDPKWRVRKLILENATLFCKQVGPDVFESSFRNILFDALNDTVYGVREVAAKQFPLLVQVFGIEWASKKLLPDALSLNAKATNYLHRMIALLVCYELAASPVELPVDYVVSSLIPVAVNFSKDPVVNARCFSVKTLAALAKKSGNNVDTIKNALMTLTQDSDTEIKLSAARALKSIA